MYKVETKPNYKCKQQQQGEYLSLVLLILVVRYVILKPYSDWFTEKKESLLSGGKIVSC